MHSIIMTCTFVNVPLLPLLVFLMQFYRCSPRLYSRPSSDYLR